MSTMRVKNKDGTWDKVPVLGSYQAVLAANEAATNAQNAATTAEKIATDLGLVDEAVQTAVASATTASNKADIATTKADIATTKASEASTSAETSTQKADSASTSAANAAQSYANADAIAGQLTEYLNTKEELTAPAVDKTLLIEGAAADSSVVGAFKSNVENYITKGDYIYTPLLENGTLNPADGYNQENTTGTTGRTVGYIDTQEITDIKFDNISGLMYIYYYDNNKNFVYPRLEISNGYEINTNYRYFRLLGYSSAGNITRVMGSWYKITQKTMLFYTKEKVDNCSNALVKTEYNYSKLKIHIDENAKGIKKLMVYGKTIQNGNGVPTVNNVRPLIGVGQYDSNLGKYLVSVAITNSDGNRYTITAQLNDYLYDGDYIDFISGNVYRQSYKYTITASATITKEQITSTKHRFRVAGSLAVWSNENGYGLCDTFLAANSAIANLDIEDAIEPYNNSALVYIVANRFATVDDFKAYLNNNNVTFIGWRKEAIEEEATLSTNIKDIEFSGTVEIETSFGKAGATYCKHILAEHKLITQGVTVGANGDYSTLLKALKCVDDGIKIRVLAGTYNILNEYIELYGDNFWDNYSVLNGAFDRFLYGLWVADKSIEFNAGAKIVANYSGGNQNVNNDFSAFATGWNATIKNLYLEYRGIRYAIHDDYAQKAGTNLFEGCIFNGTPVYSGVIGGGCGTDNTYIIKDCLFIVGGETNKNCIAYHNNKGNSGKNKIIVSGCYGNGSCAFNWFGTSTDITHCIVSNSKFKYISCAPHIATPNNVENMKLIQWNNIVD